MAIVDQKGQIASLVYSAQLYLSMLFLDFFRKIFYIFLGLLSNIPEAPHREQDLRRSLMLQEFKDYLRVHGPGYTLRRSGEKAVQRIFGTYDRIWRRQQPSPQELEEQRKHPPAAGLISIVIPIYNTAPALLRVLLNSLTEQTYQNWEAVLYDGASSRKETLDELELAAGRDSRFHIVHGTQNLGISGNTNAALAEVRGAYTVLADHDDWLSPEALWRAAEVILREKPDLIYSDEDRITEDGRRRMDPHYKPDWCPINLLGANYICHLAVIRTDLLRKIGGLRSGFDGSQDHDLFLRISEKTERISHIPRTLYSWREVGSSMSHQKLWTCLENGCRAVEEHEKQVGWAVTAVPVNKEIRMWFEVPRNISVEALIFGGTEEACQDALSELLFRTDDPRLRAALLVTDEQNLYASLNEAAASSQADYLLLLDARVRGMNRHFIRELLMYAQRPEVGGVTALLIDRRKHITHSGYAVGMRGEAQCIQEGLFHTAGGWHDALNRVRQVSAISPCCTLLRRDAWLPFEESYRSGLGAVDWSLRQRQAGRLLVCTPHAEAELLRNSLLLSGKKRNPEDLKRFQDTWGALSDPCYGSRFSRHKADYSWTK